MIIINKIDKKLKERIEQHKKNNYQIGILLQKDKRIQVVHKKNAGRILARQDGLSVAQGEYITFVDSDDWLESHFYEDLMNIVIYLRFLVYP